MRPWLTGPLLVRGLSVTAAGDVRLRGDPDAPGPRRLPEPPALPPAAPPPLPARPRPRATELPAGAAGQPGDADNPARHAAGPAPRQAVIHRPTVSGEPPWVPGTKAAGAGPLGS